MKSLPRKLATSEGRAVFWGQALGRDAGGWMLKLVLLFAARRLPLCQVGFPVGRCPLGGLRLGI